VAIAAILAVGPMTLVGCATHRVHDPYYNDVHVWDHAEDGRYRQWETETHREHLDYQRRTEADQHAYWDWRHSHHD
jgi:hypothetical protein